MREGISAFVPKIWGKEFEKEGAAWIATKWTLPMLSLHKLAPTQVEMRHVTEMVRVTQGVGLRGVLVFEAKGRFTLTYGDSSGNLDDIVVKRLTHIIQI